MSLFGTNIKKIRKLKSLSQKDFADLFGLKRGALGAYEEGRSEPKVDTIINVANYFSIPIDDLLKRELKINELLKFDTSLTTDESRLRRTFPRIPFISKSNQNDYLKYHQKESFIKNMAYIEWPVDKEGKTYRFFEISDLEMSNSQGGLYPKDIVLLEKTNLENLDTNLPALVISDEVKLRKIVKKGDVLKLVASHPAIEDVDVEISNVKELWVLVGLFQKYRKMDNQSDLQMQIDRLSKKVEDLDF